MTPDMFEQFLQLIVAKGQWLLVIIVLDVIVGVLSSIKAKTFDWDKLANFLLEYGLKIVGWLALEVVSTLTFNLPSILDKGLGQVGNGAYLALMLNGVASIVKSGRELGGNPEFLAKAGLPVDKEE